MASEWETLDLENKLEDLSTNPEVGHENEYELLASLDESTLIAIDKSENLHAIDLKSRTRKSHYFPETSKNFNVHCVHTVSAKTVLVLAGNRERTEENGDDEDEIVCSVYSSEDGFNNCTRKERLVMGTGLRIYCAGAGALEDGFMLTTTNYPEKVYTLYFVKYADILENQDSSNTLSTMIHEALDLGESILPYKGKLIALISTQWYTVKLFDTETLTVHSTTTIWSEAFSLKIHFLNRNSSPKLNSLCKFLTRCRSSLCGSDSLVIGWDTNNQCWSIDLATAECKRMSQFDMYRSVNSALFHGGFLYITVPRTDQRASEILRMHRI